LLFKYYYAGMQGDPKIWNILPTFLCSSQDQAKTFYDIEIMDGKRDGKGKKREIHLSSFLTCFIFASAFPVFKFH